MNPRTYSSGSRMEPGNEFLCALDALKSTGEASDEELRNCVDDGTVGRYASNIKVEDKG
ncbi:MAG: hypothetical protein U5L00_08985 [Desulfovermiculus sp.]|nr:hypothetical protein [Desulfovermiculus sp.]